MGQEMTITTFLIAMVLICTLTEGKILRLRRGTNELRESYLVHYNKKGEPLSVAGFEDFVRVLNRQQTNSKLTSSSFAENPEFPPLQATQTTVPKLMTTTEPTTPHQPKPLATGPSRTLESIVTGMASPGVPYVTGTSTPSPLKLPHEMSGTSPMAEASVSTDKPTLTLALGQDAVTTSNIPGGPSLSDVSNLVTPGENSPSKMTVSTLRFPHGSVLTSKVISLQPAEIQTILNYLPSSSSSLSSSAVGIRGYNIPATEMSYVHTLPTALQNPYAHSVQPETFSYASHSNGAVPLQIVRQEPSLIDIGQGLGQGYQSAPRELPINLGGFGGVDYNGHHRSIPVIKPVLSIAKLGYAIPVSNRHALSKIGFGLGSW